MNRIRRAQERDIPSILDLLIQVNRVHYEGRPDLFRGPASKYDANQLKEKLDDANHPIFVCVNEEEHVLGYVFCIEKEQEGNAIQQPLSYIYIDDICVDERARGQHVGQSLYEEVLAWAKERGAYSVTLHVWECNPAAIAFYEKLGMKTQNRTMETILK